MSPFIGRSFSPIDVELLPNGELPYEQLGDLARTHLQAVWKKNRRARWMIESCTALLATDSKELNLRQDAELLTVHFDTDVVYVNPLAVCVNCGWQANDNRYGDLLFYCSTASCQALCRQEATEAFTDELASFHDKGQCGFHPYYQSTCTGPSISHQQPFCDAHQGVVCILDDIQAVGEQGWSGSLNYFRPFCQSHWFAAKQW